MKSLNYILLIVIIFSCSTQPTEQEKHYDIGERSVMLQELRESERIEVRSSPEGYIVEASCLDSVVYWKYSDQAQDTIPMVHEAMESLTQFTINYLE